MTAPMFAPPDQAADAVGGKMQRIAVSVPKELREQIDDFRWAQRLESRAEAIRRLVEAGLEAEAAGAMGQGAARSLRKTAE
jgi:metal-responsive CopG/Arc/MetJ family transcriptional regulator